MGHWGTHEFDPTMKNAWFTDGSSTVTNNVVKWKAAAYRPGDGIILTESRQSNAEVIAALLAARQSIKESQKILHLFTDSWCVANGIAIWSGKWKQPDWKINGKDIWSKEAWKELDEISNKVKILVYHVDAHTNKQDLVSEHNRTVDRLAAAVTLARQWEAEPTKTGVKFKRHGKYCLIKI